MTTATILEGNCLDVMKTLPDNSVDSIVTDPPYELGFMGRKWDSTGIAFNVDVWKEAYRVLKPGGHLLAFSGTRTQHRMVVAIEDAGFDIRDQIAWTYGTGFPKSLNVSKAIDSHLGAERGKIRIDSDEVRNPKASGAGRDGQEGATRPWIEEALEKGYHEKDDDTPITDEAKQWDGWGTALKPAWEPICVARKPLIGTVAENVLEHGTGGLNIDKCRVGGEGGTRKSKSDDKSKTVSVGSYLNNEAGKKIKGLGRWPANLVHDGSDEVLTLFPETKSGAMKHKVGAYESVNNTNFMKGFSGPNNQHGDSGSAARFFYSAKASKVDRSDSKHPTVKPVKLMRWLCRMVTPPNGVVLDPFAGSGSTGQAALEEGFNPILIELDPQSVKDIYIRLEKMEPDVDEDGEFTFSKNELEFE